MAGGAGAGADVGDYIGYEERLATAVRRREFPSSDVVMAIAFGGDPLQAMESAGGSSTCLVAAPHDSVLVTGHRGLQQGVAIQISPLRAYSLLGQPMHTLSNQLVDGQALLGTTIVHLVERLAAESDWKRRFNVLNTALTALLAVGPAPDRAVQWAWRRLKASAGATPIAFVAEQIGWSRRHLERKFLQQVGLPPKTMARIFRFERALTLLSEANNSQANTTLADIAAQAGYSDQSHLSREVRAFTQCSPSELTRIRTAAYPPTTKCPDVASVQGIVLRRN